MVPMLLSIVSVVLLVAAGRMYVILNRAHEPKSPRSRRDSCKLAVFLGSGGHTSEALSLLSSLDFSRYRPRTYLCSQADLLSAKKAAILEAGKAAESSSHTSQDTHSKTPPYTIVTIPRARRVHQSILTTPLTAFRSLAVCLYLVGLVPLITGEKFADVIILNGPGTCCMLCVAVYFNKFFGLHSPRIIYIESFARVRTLSLSGKLLRPFVDRFIVQWPDLLKDRGRGECHGWLV